jgi:hypothetical protein
MASLADYEDDETLNKYLSEQLTAGSLTLVLGAGVSTHFGLPSWKKLIGRLFKAKRAATPKRDPKRQAEEYRNRYHKNDVKGFLKAVRTALYRDISIDLDAMRSHNTMAAVASVIMVSNRRSGTSQIITFNWDDLLETYLEYHGFVTQSVGEEKYWSKGVDVTILHPHGCLPYAEGRRRASRDIIFDQFSYTKAIGTKGDAWRQLLLSVMRTHTCLFIGLSGGDDNLDSLLERCMAQHASGLDHSLYWGIAFSTSDKDSTFWERRRVFLKTVPDYKKSLSQFLFRICQGAGVQG